MEIDSSGHYVKQHLEMIRYIFLLGNMSEITSFSIKKRFAQYMDEEMIIDQYIAKMMMEG